AGPRLATELGPARAVGDLHRAIAVLVLRLDLGDAVRQDLDARHRHGFAGVGEDPRHAGLATDQSDSHSRSSHDREAPEAPRNHWLQAKSLTQQEISRFSPVWLR